MLLCALLAGAAGGCQRGGAQVAITDIPVIPVAQPITRNVTPYVDFTGRTDAVESVNIVARVTGYLRRKPFKEGSEVKTRDLLFEIDPRPYEAQYDQAESQVSLAQAQLDLAESTLARWKALKKEQPGGVSDQALDQYKAAVTEARARVNATKKSLEVYRLNKEFTRVVSPIDGQVGRSYLTLGNLVNQDQTLLTTVVSLDPMYAYFEMDERTLLQIRRAINEGTIELRGQGTEIGRERILGALLAAQGFPAPGSAPCPPGAALTALAVAALAPAALEAELPVYMGLQGEDGFPHKGTINFANNQVNPGTGSISVRGLFANPKGQKGVRLLSPGMFVRIRFPLGQAHPALLVIDRAVQSDQGKKYVYVIDADNKAQSRFVKTGALQPDGLRVITGGLRAADWVVVGAMQQVRPGMEVKTDRQKIMPSFQPDEGQ
ncbi:MAG TPA: efflux RND transporter periplasmic adaptor subunit [Gemmataceae bacterium]|jgi:multidrug efflux system membrane fusion protein|nr:efflux RND transporter periplasmic adaptor subunit [Gemmataceae bacterium]